MPAPRRFYIVDDNLAVATTAKVLLEQAGHEATICTSSPEALQDIPRQRPDCVLLDIMLPELDGLELCRRLRTMETLQDLKIVMFSSKAFEYDHQRAFEMGADGYIQKPIKADTFLAQINTVMLDDITMQFWGVRGTMPRPGKDANKYGGNTSCVSLTFPRGQFFIFDAGSGIKQLGDHLLAAGTQRISGKLFISHPHWDHINTIPFFAPLYIRGNEFEILGASQGNISISDQVKAQMEGVYFPVTIREFGAHVYFRDLQEDTYDVDGIQVQTMLLSHPGNCLGYRVHYRGRSICYITDNELFLPASDFYSDEYVERLTTFIAGTDVLITDTAYTDDQYVSKVGWGHSCLSQVVNLADRAKVKTLYLFHHDPSQDDDAIDKKLAVACAMLAERGSPVTCVAPTENQLVRV